MTPAAAPDSRDGPGVLLSDRPPSRLQRRLALGLLAGLLGALLLAAPFARHPLPDTEALVPAYATALSATELMTAAMLLALFSVERSRRILVLAAAYLFSGLTVIGWALTFPGVATQLGLEEAGPQATASIAALRRIGFPLLVLAHALLPERRGGAAERPGAGVPGLIIGCVAAATLAAAGALWAVLAHDEALPRFMADARTTTGLWIYVPVASLALYLATLAALWARRRSVLNLWLMVVICTLLIEIILLSFLAGGIRLTVGWWAGRLYGLASASLVLIVMLAETASLSARLAHAMEAERRAREARLLTMQALSASIAHEVNQPLASMVTNADAALRWLAKESPELEEARAALRRIVADGHRAGKVVEGIRTMIRRGAQERRRLDMRQLILDTLARCQHEARHAHVAIRTEIDGHLPMVTGNPTQLEQVILNLVTNAMEAMSEGPERQRMLRIRAACQDEGHVLVSVEDQGPGLDAAQRDRIFEPFFTTKPQGMGLGLMFCQSVVEAHGGRLWAGDNPPRGAAFRFTLPVDIRDEAPRA